RRSGHGEGGVRDRPAAAARGAGDPLRPAVRRAVRTHLRSVALGGRAGLRPQYRCDRFAGGGGMSARRPWTPRRRLILGLRIGVLVIWLGAWEVAARIKLIDPFFFGQPSAVWSQIVTWVTQGTAQG